MLVRERQQDRHARTEWLEREWSRRVARGKLQAATRKVQKGAWQRLVALPLHERMLMFATLLVAALMITQGVDLLLVYYPRRGDEEAFGPLFDVVGNASAEGGSTLQRVREQQQASLASSVGLLLSGAAVLLVSSSTTANTSLLRSCILMGGFAFTRIAGLCVIALFESGFVGMTRLVLWVVLLVARLIRATSRPEPICSKARSYSMASRSMVL